MGGDEGQKVFGAAAEGDEIPVSLGWRCSDGVAGGECVYFLGVAYEIGHPDVEAVVGRCVDEDECYALR